MTRVSTPAATTTATSTAAAARALIEPEGMQAADAARFVGVSRSKWWALVSEGRTPEPVRIGRVVLWRRSELVGWLAAGCPNREHWAAMRHRRGGRRG